MCRSRVAERLILTTADIIGPNSAFVTQSGTFPKQFSDFAAEDSELIHSGEDEMVKQALVNDYGVEVTPNAIDMVKILAG